MESTCGKRVLEGIWYQYLKHFLNFSHDESPGVKSLSIDRSLHHPTLTCI